MDFINCTKYIKWHKLVDDFQGMFSEQFNMNQTMNFVSEHVWRNSLVSASILSILFVLVYWVFIYLDSSKPGVNPPTPFSTGRKERYRTQKEAQYHLNYVMGPIIGSLLFFSLVFKVFEN